MKKFIFSGITVVVIAVAAVFNLNNSSNSSLLSDLALANIEALAGGDIKPSDKGGYDEQTDKATYELNGKAYKKSVVVTCSDGGPKAKCTESCTYQQINDDDTWTEWMPC